MDPHPRPQPTPRTRKQDEFLAILNILMAAHHVFQIDRAFDVFDKNDLSFDDWEELPQSDDCVNDNSPSCKDEWPDKDS